MAVADGAILRIVASILFPESVIAQNVFYAVFADTGTSDDEADVVTDLGTWLEDMYDHLDGECIATLASGGFKVYNYDSIDDDWDEVGADTWADTFAGAGDMLPHGVAAVIHAKTTDPDVQAAKFLGGLTEDTQDNSILEATPLAELANFANEWTAPFVGAATGADFAPGVWSVAQQNFFLFNGVEVINATLGYQRRRKPGVGI